MGRVSTDRKVYMEPEEEISTSSCSSPSAAHKGLTYNHHTNSSSGSSNSCITAATTTSATTTTTPTTDGTSTIRSGLRKLSSLNINTRRKAFTKLGSQNDYEQIQGGDHPPSSDTTHAARGIFSSHHRSNTFGAFGASSYHPHRGEGEVVVRIDGPAPPRADPTSVGANDFAVSGGPPRLQSDTGPAELRVAGQPLPPPRKPLLNEVDSFDEDDNDDEHFRVPSAVSSPTATSGARPNFSELPPRPEVEFTDSCRKEDGGGGRQDDEHVHVQSAVSSPRAVPGAGGNSPGLPPRPPKGEFTESTRKEDNGGSSQGGSFGIQSEGSYDFRNDLPIPEASGSSGSECAAPGGAANSSSSRRKGKSFDFGTIPEDDPPTKLIGAFLRRQTESGSNFLDLDMDMEELTPISNQAGVLPVGDEQEEQVPSPERNSFVKDSSYVDLVSLDRPMSSSAPTSFMGVVQLSSSAEELRRWKKQALNHHSDPLAFPQDVTPEVRINVAAEERYQKSREEAIRVEAAATRTSSPENGGIGIESPSPAGMRMRKNGSFRPSPSPPRTSVGEEVVKAPTQFVVRPSMSRLKSRLADLPKPTEVTPKASGAIDENKIKSGVLKNSRELKSGLLGTKLKKVEEEEEDPLKDTDLPEKYRKREKGLWTIFQLSALLIILAGLACVLSFPTLRKMNRGGLALWKWVLLVMVVFSGRLISGWIVWFVVFIIEKNFLLRKRVVYFVYALRKGVQNCLWLGFALLAWHFMIDPKVDSNRKVVNYVTKVLICFLVAAIIVLVKTFIVKVFASSFHVNNYFERIQEALLNQYIMETLAGLPLLEYEQELEDEKRLVEEIAGLRDAGATGPSFSKLPNLPPIATTRPAGLPPRPSVTTTKSTMIGTPTGMVGSQQQSGMIGRTPRADEAKKKTGSKAELNLGISIDHLQKLDLSNISAWNMKRLIHIIRNSTLTHSLEETVNSEDGAEMEIQSEWQAKAKAKQIFRNVAKPGQKVIMEDDLLRFMDEELAKKALDKFEGGTETKRVTKQALKKWAIDVYKERRALAYSLNDTKTAVNKLHRIIDFVVFIIIIVIWLLVLGIATTKLLLFLSSQILLLILVWGNTLRTVFEAIVFLFVMHPFDVGDRCLVDGMQLVVEEMNILTTVFLGDFNAKVWYPNSVLATKPIQNFYRSPEMGDGIEFIVQANTPVEKIAAFKERIGKYIQSKPNHWHQEFVLNVLQMTEGERMKLSLGLKHTVNYQDFGEIIKRRSELLLEIKFNLMELGIEYRLPAQEVLIRQPPQGLQNRQ